MYSFFQTRSPVEVGGHKICCCHATEAFARPQRQRLWPGLRGHSRPQRLWPGHGGCGQATEAVARPQRGCCQATEPAARPERQFSAVRTAMQFRVWKTSSGAGKAPFEPTLSVSTATAFRMPLEAFDHQKQNKKSRFGGRREEGGSAYAACAAGSSSNRLTPATTMLQFRAPRGRRLKLGLASMSNAIQAGQHFKVMG